jgi:SAM-dependent methyltransferase
MSDPLICDYEDSDYRTRFWEGQGREYEDAVERIAIGRLLPPAGGLLMDLGAGYGRLADMYPGYRRVVLFDYSRSQLLHARSQLESDPRYVYVAGDLYRLPFAAGLFDVVTQVRVIHHAADVPAAFREVRSVIRPAGVYLLEFANKQNLKAIVRFLLRRQDWSPFDRGPVEFAELNFDFHPGWIRKQLDGAGFCPGKTLAVSYLRLQALKRWVPVRWLVALDSLAQGTGRWWQLSPSVFVRSTATASGPTASAGLFFSCPDCSTPLPSPAGLLQRVPPGDQDLVCPDCGRQWPVRDGVFDFR